MKKLLLIFLIIFTGIEFLNAQQSDYVATLNNSFGGRLTKSEVLSNPKIIVYKNGQTYPVYQIDFFSLKINEVHYSERGDKLTLRMIERIKTLTKNDLIRLDVKIKVEEKIIDINSIFIILIEKERRTPKTDLVSVALIGNQTRQELTIDELLNLKEIKVKSSEKLEILNYKVIYYDKWERKQFTNIGRLFNPELKAIIKKTKRTSTLIFTDINIGKNGERYMLNQVIIKIK